ncbi:MAG: type 1 glutamine amidotransferase [Melioribacteraceae bacterium]|nr:type 1 glutamine amidotransferase [Melioribacteraceae bacterium]
MKIHYLQHVEYESPGLILDWAKRKNHQISLTKFHLNESLPNNIDFDFLIVMGGPMSIYDIANHPYLAEEKIFIKSAIDKGKSILGICLGAQLIADVLGAEVKPNREKEIGWFPIETVENIGDYELNNILNTDKPVFHWHGDTFEIPQGAKRLAKSDACKNQAFVYNKNVFALQYHLEMTESTLKMLIENCRGELIDAPFIQTEQEMITAESNFNFSKNRLYSLLDYIEKEF